MWLCCDVTDKLGFLLFSGLVRVECGMTEDKACVLLTFRSSREATDRRWSPTITSKWMVDSEVSPGKTALWLVLSV